MRGNAGTLWGSGIHPVHLQAGPTYKRRVEPEASGPPPVLWFLPLQENARSKLNSQSFPCVFVSHDHVHVWAHKLNMQHLQKENFFWFSDQDPISCLMRLFICEHDCPFWPHRDCFASPWWIVHLWRSNKRKAEPFFKGFWLIYCGLRPSTQPRLINWLCHTLVKTTCLAQDLFLSLSGWQKVGHTRTQFDHASLAAARSSSTWNP